VLRSRASFGFGTLAILDKSQVIALDLIRQKIGKNPRRLIRRKFSIDAASDDAAGRIHQFETMMGPFRKPGIHHLRVRRTQSSGEVRVFCRVSRRLSVRLMSL
jgi:hypothetical protein